MIKPLSSRESRHNQRIRNGGCIGWLVPSEAGRLRMLGASQCCSGMLTLYNYNHHFLEFTFMSLLQSMAIYGFSMTPSAMAYYLQFNGNSNGLLSFFFLFLQLPRSPYYSYRYFYTNWISTSSTPLLLTKLKDV